ncbi:hypothetical protein ABEW00_02485 [Rossellomorea vietnamensis]|uniref:hypothetical protein n=1 Tax=Rossellomorea vietnamensis TaxID=218284 RepID=UPI003D2D7B00
MKHRFFAACLSFTMPGLGQIYNRDLLKGIVLLLLEHIVNRLSHINSAIMLSFNGEHLQALNQVNYEFALFYPGFYTLCVFDSVLNAQEDPNKDCSLWFIFSGLAGCLGIIYGRFIPMPLFLVGLAMICLMVIGTYVCSRGETIKTT